MEQVLEDTLKFAITLISILNPIGIIPIFINLTRNSSETQVKKISHSCSIAVVVTIIVSLVIGQGVLGFFGISIASFTIGGGLLLSSMAFSMIQAQSSNAKINEEEIHQMEDIRELGIVPLAIPLLSGPGAISTAIIHSKGFETSYDWIGAIFVVLVTGFIIKLILTSSRKIGERLGTIGLNVMTRIMGIILLAISIEMIVGGIKEILPILKAA